MEVLQTPPSASSFTSLAEHQSRTPESFYDGAPVLHYHSSRCKVVVLESDLTASHALNTLRGGVSNANGSSDESTEGKEIVLDGVDVFVASDKFLLYRAEASSGVALPYPLISLHAIQRFHLPGTSADEPEVQGLYMQLAKPRSADETGANEEDEEEDSITLTIVPPPVIEAASSALGSYTAGTETAALLADEMATKESADTKPEETSTTQALFTAVSACSNLHPDPVVHGEDEEEEDYYGDSSEQPGVGGILQAGLIMPGATDGGLPPPVDGSLGWITAENMHEYFDEEGNWIADGEPPASMSMPGLGPGAGNVHGRHDDDVENGNGAGTENGDDETKWRRTD